MRRNMEQEHKFPPLDEIRKQCNEQLKKAIEEQNWEKALFLSEIKGYIRRDDCLDRKNWRYFRPLVFIGYLGYSLTSIIEAEEQIREMLRFKGKLQYVDKKGKVYSREAMLDPEEEEYYFFENFGFVKIRTWNFYSLNNKGKWEYDVDAERRYYDAQYTYHRATIVKE